MVKERSKQNYIKPHAFILFELYQNIFCMAANDVRVSINAQAVL